ncbi:YoaK family protein [Mucilaginibacter celer]|uniref:DUF1275 domain-containing protein n=1 Tax=Mucilaginibacter celer TaxID=2305508 RepID=A0A494VV62_9SPHI|nr:YoaK family protein [Mucilaginibacter celer]AYL97951.1 DUF1275 domain-containing protein [Mucilaginibacter celer]
MSQVFNTNYGSLCLSFAGGFCDAVTFVMVTEMFSVHVTGNFIEFSGSLILGADNEAWSKLLVFPVFVIAVMIGGAMLAVGTKPFKVLITEAVILAFCALLSFLGWFYHYQTPRQNYLLALCIVFAMGLQNAFGKVFSKNLYGATTVMTGNVAQLSLDLVHCLFLKPGDSEHLKSLKQNLITVSGFLSGALAGTLGAKIFGIGAVVVPSVMLFGFSLTGMVNASKARSGNEMQVMPDGV